MNFDNFIVIDFKESFKNIDKIAKQTSKVIVFSPKCTLHNVKFCISQLTPKFFPHLFMFVIEADNFEALVTETNQKSKDMEIIIDHVKQFETNRPLVMQITAANGTSSKFFYKLAGSDELVAVDILEHFEDFRRVEDFINCFKQGRLEEFADKIVENVTTVENSSLVLRFLRTLELPIQLFDNLLLKCAAKGSKDDFLAILDASFQDEGRSLDVKAQNILSEMYDFNQIPSETSILQIAVENSNQSVTDYLITHCTHLIQQLPFEHRVHISTTAFKQKEFGILCRLLKLSDFPFPNDFQDNSTTNDELRKIMTERKDFHDTISTKDKLSSFIEKNANLKKFYNIKNQSALSTAIKFKNFKGFAQLKSFGFALEDDENMNSLSEKEQKQLEKTNWRQTIKNVDVANTDVKKSAMFLAARSLVHNRMTKEELDRVYRQQIRTWFDDLSKINLCCLLLDAASQCEELKIIFDFESESVENVDLKNSSASLGTTYMGRKWIFIGAKGTDQSRIQEIKGVLIHEICHYVMRLVYENNDNPFYEADEDSKKMFMSILREIKKMLAGDNVDDECGGIILSVFESYKEKDHPQELIVRPAQILAQFSEENGTIELLEAKYGSLFVYHSLIIRGEVRNFSLQKRQIVRKVNQIAGLMTKIKAESYEISSLKNIHNSMNDKCSILITNVPKLLLINIFKYIQKENLPDTKNVFTTPEIIKNEDNLKKFQQILQNSDLKIFIDCSSSSFQGFEATLKEVISNTKANLIFIASNGRYSTELLDILTEEMMNSKQEVNYKFCDLSEKTQKDLLETEVKFQKYSKVPLGELILISEKNDSSPQEPGQNQEDHESSTNIIDENLLNMLVNRSKITVNANENEDQDEHFEILYQPRKFIKANSLEQTVRNTQEALLLEVKNMKSILISDFAGTGKTWAMKSITRILQKQNAVKWITYVDLKQHLNAFKTQKLQINFSKFIIENVLKLQNKFEENIFDKLYKNGKVCILFDSFDEIPPDHVDFVINLFKSFKFHGDNQLWIASRDNMEATLKDNIKFDATFKLDEFSEQDGMNLIKLTWALNDLKNKVIFKENVKELVENHSMDEKFQTRLKKWIGVISKMHNRSIGLPQFHKIIAAFEDNQKTNQKDMMNTYKIYFKFMFHQCNKDQNPEEVDLNAMKVHRYNAMKTLFTDENRFCELLPYHLDKVEGKIIACGLMIKINENYLFHHQSFQEFFITDFAVSYPLDNMKNEKGIEIFVNFLLMILSTYKFEVIRMFLNDALSDEERIKIFAKVIKDHMMQVQCHVDEIFPIIFKEGLENVSKLMITIYGDNNYVQIKGYLQATIHHAIKTSVNSESFQKYQGIIVDFMTQSDLKEFIEQNEIFQKIVRSKLDPCVLKDLADRIEIKVDSNFVREMLTKPEKSGNRNIFHLLCLFKDFKEIIFQNYFDKVKLFLRDYEILKMIKNFDDAGKKVMHTCIEMKNVEMVKFMWQNIKIIFTNEADFKEFIMVKATQNNSSILHLAAVCNNPDFHTALWTLMLETITKQHELYNFVSQIDNNGNNFLHLLVSGCADVMNDTILLLEKRLSKSQFKEILISKDKQSRNLLQIAACKSTNTKMHQTLWEFYQESFKLYGQFLNILEEIDADGNNILHMVACHSTEQVFKFIMDELEGSKDTIMKLLKAVNNQQQNILQISTLNNNRLELHNYLWNIIQTKFENHEILDFINSFDSSGFNLITCAVSSNTKDVVELTWNKIIKIINTEDDQIHYLTKIKDGVKSTHKISIENRNNPDVFVWIDKLLRKMSKHHLHGKPECVVKITENSQIEVNDEALKVIFNNEIVKNSKIVALSIVGAFRKGKSFLLNYCLRYLYAHYKSINFPENPLTNCEEWMGENDEPLRGFSWKSGANRDTTGIVLWNDAFIFKDKYTGENIAIIVIDTEGLFNMKNSVLDDSRIFAISTLISSMQMFNSSGLLQEDMLSYLNFAIEFTKFTILDTQEMYKPLQSLLILVRDWVCSENYAYGMGGGELYSNDILKGDCDLTIRSTFDQFNCFLLPHPGKAVTGSKKNSKKFDGNWGDMDEDFKEELIKLIEELLKPEKLIVKKINGTELIGTKFLEYVHQYFKLFQTDKLPPAQTIYESSVENQISILVDLCFNNYERMIMNEKPLITNYALVPIFHERSKDKTILMYKNFKKAGNFKHEKQFEKILVQKIDVCYENWAKELNSAFNN